MILGSSEKDFAHPDARSPEQADQGRTGSRLGRLNQRRDR
jgi:hypothetical protein